MLENLKGKKVEVGVAFSGREMSFTKYFIGVVSDFDDNFIMFTDGSMIGIRYIQVIKVK